MQPSPTRFNSGSCHPPALIQAAGNIINIINIIDIINIINIIKMDRAVVIKWFALMQETLVRVLVQVVLGSC